MLKIYCVHPFYTHCCRHRAASWHSDDGKKKPRITLLLSSRCCKVECCLCASFVQCVQLWIRLNISTVSSSSSFSFQNRIGLFGYSFSQHIMSMIKKKNWKKRERDREKCLDTPADDRRNWGWSKKLNRISIKKCLEMLSIKASNEKLTKTQQPLDVIVEALSSQLDGKKREGILKDEYNGREWQIRLTMWLNAIQHLFLYMNTLVKTASYYLLALRMFQIW